MIGIFAIHVFPALGQHWEMIMVKDATRYATNLNAECIDDNLQLHPSYPLVLLTWSAFHDQDVDILLFYCLCITMEGLVVERKLMRWQKLVFIICLAILRGRPCSCLSYLRVTNSMTESFCTTMIYHDCTAVCVEISLDKLTVCARIPKINNSFLRHCFQNRTSLLRL